MTIAYTEMMSSWAGTAGTAWTDYDIYTNKGIPKGAVVEIAICNALLEEGSFTGLRTDGSIYDRTSGLNEAEAGGENSDVVYVTVHATTGLIEEYRTSTSDHVTYRILGYLTNVIFTEYFASVPLPASVNTWTEKTLYVGASCVHVINCLNQELDVANNLGVRAKGSTLSRYIKLHEREGIGGGNYISFLVKADASKKIEIYQEDISGVAFLIDMGYFDSSVDFIEGWTQINQTAEGTWQNADLSAYLDQDGRIANLILTHSTAGVEKYLGVRTNGSLLSRYILVHESEPGGTEYNGYTVSVKTAADGTVSLYAGEDTTDYFWFAGYFKDVGGGPTTGWNKLQYFTEPPTTGAFNKLKFASEPPISGAWNKLLYAGE